MDLLKLIALDADDLSIISAHVQDAVTKIGDIKYEPKAKRLILPLHRFVWEIEAGKFRKPHNERRNTVLHFEGVRGVKAAAIDRNKPQDVLELLALTFEPGEAPGGAVILSFAANATLRLEVDYVEARLTDLGGAWEASSRPRHQV